MFIIPAKDIALLRTAVRRRDRRFLAVGFVVFIAIHFLLTHDLIALCVFGLVLVPLIFLGPLVTADQLIKNLCAVSYRVDGCSIGVVTNNETVSRVSFQHLDKWSISARKVGSYVSLHSGDEGVVRVRFAERYFENDDVSASLLEAIQRQMATLGMRSEGGKRAGL